MDNSSTGLLTSDRASVKQVLAVSLADLKHKDLLNTVGDLGPITRVVLPVTHQLPQKFILGILFNHRKPMNTTVYEYK